MTKGQIFTFFVFWFIYIVFISLFNHSNLTWSLFLSFIVTGFLVSLFVTLSSMRSERQFMRKLLVFDETEFDGEVLQKDWMNHFQFMIFVAHSGFGFLFKDSLIFVQQKKRDTGKRFEILFSDVATVSDTKFFGLINTGLKITLKSGKAELFALDKQSEFYRALMSRF